MMKFGNAKAIIGIEYFAMSSANGPLKAGAKLKFPRAVKNAPPGPVTISHQRRQDRDQHDNDAAPEIMRLQDEPGCLCFVVRRLPCAFSHTPPPTRTITVPLGSSPKLADLV